MQDIRALFNVKSTPSQETSHKKDSPMAQVRRYMRTNPSIGDNMNKDKYMAKGSIHHQMETGT